MSAAKYGLLSGLGQGLAQAGAMAMAITEERLKREWQEQYQNRQQKAQSAERASERADDQNRRQQEMAAEMAHNLANTDRDIESRERIAEMQYNPDRMTLQAAQAVIDAFQDNPPETEDQMRQLRHAISSLSSLAGYGGGDSGEPIDSIYGGSIGGGDTNPPPSQGSDDRGLLSEMGRSFLNYRKQGTKESDALIDFASGIGAVVTSPFRGGIGGALADKDTSNRAVQQQLNYYRSVLDDNSSSEVEKNFARRKIQELSVNMTQLGSREY